jgi:hypothetical protein
MTILIDLSVAGVNTGPFNLYSDADNYTSAFATNITRQQLLDGYPAVVDAGTTNIKLQSLSDICPNDTILPVSTTTSTTSTSTSTTTTTSTSTSTTTTTTTVTCYTVGQAALGGIIAYILEPGDPGYVEGTCKGLVAASSDQGTVLWGCQTISVVTETAIGTGQQNTINIINSCSTPGIAAALCADYSITINGTTYNDWFLPSIDELEKLCQNRYLIGNFDTSGNSYYWSSTQFDTGDALGWIFNSCDSLNAFKNLPCIVRAVRSF